MFRTILLLCLLTISCGSLLAQVDSTAAKQVVPPNVNSVPQPPPKNIPESEKNLYTPRQFGHELGKLVVRPIHWKGKDWATLAAVTAVTIEVMQFDQQVRDFAHPYSSYGDNFAVNRVGNEWGGFYFIPITTVLLYSHGWLAHNETTKKLGFEIGEAAAFSEIVSFTMKNVAGRSRPQQEKGSDHWEPFTVFSSPHNSFPAGHIDAAMALSTVLSKNATSPILKVLAYVPAALTVSARILQDEHWASDVVFGAALGYCVGSWVVNLHRQNESALQVSSLYPLGVKYSIR